MELFFERLFLAKLDKKPQFSKRMKMEKVFLQRKDIKILFQSSKKILPLQKV
jgi:hypothetical protein